MNTPTYAPFVPMTFDGTLILGESVPKGPDPNTRTGWDLSFDEGYPKTFIQKHVKEHIDIDQTTFRKLRESFEPVLSPEEFWARKAFTNFIPELLTRLESGRMPRPTKEQWALGKEEFDAILDVVRPQRILVVGWDLWENLPQGEHEQGDRCFFRTNIFAMCIPHPASWNRKKPIYTVADARNVTAILMKHSGIA